MKSLFYHRMKSLFSNKKFFQIAALRSIPAVFMLTSCANAQQPAAQAPVRQAPVTHPNILFVLSDDQSARFVGCYGDATARTPNIDRFAAEGLRFDRAYVSSPQCVPSRATFMTGRSPIAVGMSRFSAPLPAATTTYLELLRSGAGYYTGICGRTYHMDGPDDSRLAPETSKFFKDSQLRTFKNRVDYLRSSNQAKSLTQMKEFLDQVPQGKPWFLQVDFNDPHRPFDENAVAHPHDTASLKLPPFMPDTPGLRQDLARYYDECTRLDADFATVLNTLKERGLDKNTMVVFMGDNGAALLRGKGTLYEIGVKVPLIIRWPGQVKPGSASSSLVSGEDLAPTFLQAAGVPVPKEMSGRSFVPLLKGEPFQARQVVFSERGAHGQVALPTDTGAFDLGRVAISPTHKLIYNVLWQLPYAPVDFEGNKFWKQIVASNQEGTLGEPFKSLYFPPARPMFELYDLASDPEEMHNLSGKPEVASIEETLKEQMQEWMITDRDFVPLPRGDNKAAIPAGD